MSDAHPTRRRFLVAAGSAAAFLAMPGRALAGDDDDPPAMKMDAGGDDGSAMDHADHAGHGSKMKMEMDPLADRFPRRVDGAPISPPPATVGRQMGRVVTLGQPALGYELDGKVKVFTLVAQPVELTITAGTTEGARERLVIPPEWQRFGPRPTVPKECLTWGYNGMCPGPTIEATEGDRVRVVLRNELPEPTSIHWHGLELPFSEDGASGYHAFEARRPLLPGQTEEYEFDLIQSGTLLYHTGFNVMKQEGMGLGGFFIIHPRDEARKPDHDFAFLLQQWTFAPGNPNPNINAMEPSFATFNGKTAPDVDMMRVAQGDRVRIRIGNLSLLPHPIHIHGHVFTVVGTTGGPSPESARWREVTVNVAPGQTRDIELVAWNPGTWRMHCHVLHHLMNQMPDMPMGIAPAEGMFTHLHVEPKDAGYDPRRRDASWTYPREEERH